MAVSELNLAVNQGNVALRNRPLGLLGMIGAPTLMVQALCIDIAKESQSVLTKQLVAFLGVLYIGGWICGAIGMFRQNAYGESKTSKIVFTVQMILLLLAFMFSVQETFGISYENGGGIFFAVCDAGYPLSHLFMIVIGIFVWRTKIWRGFPRLAPFLVGAALPLTFALMPLLGMSVGFLSFAGLTTIGLGKIGYSVYSNRK